MHLHQSLRWVGISYWSMFARGDRRQLLRALLDLPLGPCPREVGDVIVVKVMRSEER